MENKIIITTEVSSDLSPELQGKLGIKTIPLHVHLDGKEYLDGEVSNQFVYDTFMEKKVLPSTSAVAVGEYADFFEETAKNGETIIHIALSSGISSTYQNAVIAAEDVGEDGTKVYVIDSKVLSSATGLLAYKAAEMAQAGVSAEEIVSVITGYTEKMDNTFLITNLDFLRHGGRCSALAALGANMLKLKPMINMAGGSMSVEKKYRGKVLDAYLEYADDRLGACDFDEEYICIANCLVEEDMLDSIVKHIKSKYKAENIIITPCSTVISAHGGKGAFGVFLLKK